MTPPPSESALRSLLAAKLAARLGVDPSATNLQESFQSHGLDSSGAVGLIAELSSALGRPLSPTLIWAHPNPEELARFLAVGDSGPVRTARSAAADEPIAVVGMACRFPGASDLEAFWRLVCSGVDATREVPVERWDPEGFYDPDPEAPGTTNTRRGAFLERIDEFDPLFFGISPREAAEMDPQQRIMLELAWEALEDAGVPPRDLAGTKAGVFFGVVWRDYAELHRAAGAAVTSHTGVGQGVTIVANRVSYALGLRGPSLVVDTACSSSLVAVHLACQSLRAGESTVALAGGVNLMLLPETMVALTKFGGLSGEGRCKAFDARADGFARGEGAGVVVLKPLSRALADGDPVYCVIRGSAVNNDGASNGLTAPNPLAQVEVLQEAWERAGIDPGRVQVVEAHGTGTPLGDPIEARALAQVLCASRDPERPLVIGSVKTNIGHLEAAAGIAGLIKLALAIHHRMVPPSLHFERPNPDIPFSELGLRVQTALGPWPAGDGPALGGVSSFGWGGTNCHVVVEGLRVPPPRALTPSPSPAPSPPPSPGEGNPTGAFVPSGLSPSSPGEGGGRGREKRAGVMRVLGGGKAGPLFVFSGIGSQWPGMGVDLLRSEPVFRARLEACDRALAPLIGWSVVDELVSDQDTGGRWEWVDVAVPSIFAMEVALAALWRSWGVEPAAVIGHSVGEFAAAHVAGLLSLEDAALVAFHYSRLLARLEGTVGLGVVQLPADEVAERIADEGDRLAVAGWSSPSSTLVAGEPEPLDRLLAAVAAQGLFSTRVPTDIAAHCPQVEPLLDELRQSLAGLSPRTGRIPMISTVTGEPVRQPLDADYWAANLRQPVRFAQAVEHALREGTGIFLEVDPHPVLATPLEQCFAAFGAPAVVLPSLRRGEEGRAVLSGSLRVLGYRPREAGPTIVPLSARSPEARRELALRTAARLRVPGSETVGDFGWTAALRRTHHEHRLAVVGRSRDEMAERLEVFARGETPPGVTVGRAGRERGGLVFAFSGQGPQWSGMGRQLLDTEPVFRDAVERCDAALRPWLGGPLLERLEVEEDALERTELAQPALFALQVGLTEVWRSWGVIPDAVVGHSVGEVAAAWAAGVLSLEEAARVVAVRGRAMAGARGLGGMVAVEMPEEEIRALLADLGSPLEVAAVNGPASTVLAGAPEDLTMMMEELARRGATGRRLRVDYAFHTVQMEPFDAKVEAELADLRPHPAAVPLISTVTGRAVHGPEMDGAYWRRNVRQPVRFGEAVASLAGHTAFLEIGPHPVLAVSISQGLESVAVLASLRRGRDERETLLEALGGLYVLGHPIDWRGVFPDGGRRAPLPTYPFQHQRYWFETPSRPAVVAAPSLLPETHPMPASSRHARLASTLQGIFGRVLRIEPQQIDVETPFLELGADSLALVEALRGIQEAYGVKLTIRQLFERLPSISALAGFLAESVVEETASPSKPHPRPLSQGERGDLAEGVEPVGGAVRTVDVLEGTHSVPYGNPARRSPPSPPGRGAGGEVSEGTWPDSAPTFQTPSKRQQDFSGGSSVERVLSTQLQAFNQLVAQQLQAMGGQGAPAPVQPPPAPATPVAKPVLPTHLGKVRPATELNERQRRHLDELIARYTRKTAKSKALTEAYRPWLADSRGTVGFRSTTKEMLYPLARHRSRGSRIWDIDGNEYVDVTMGMGVHLFGHDPEFLRETMERQVREGFELGPRSAHSGEVAALFCELTGMERATFTNSGTEACMTALRLARARTGRTKIVMFAGSYHGHSDGTLAQTQEIDSELRSFPVAPGIPPKVAEDVLVLDYGAPESLEVIRRHRQELAAVIVEPIQSRRPEIQPRDFLHELRRLTAESGIALIFDEMICGFRLHLGGAQAHFGVRADLATYGKVVGGGLPIGVVAGAADFMDGIDGGAWRYGDDSRPERETTFFGGTFCQHPLAMAAAKTVLTYLKEQGPGLQEGLNARTARFAGRLNVGFEKVGAPIRAVHAHSLFRFHSTANLDLLYYQLVDKGVYVWEWRNCFLSTAHTDADLDFVARAVGESVVELQQGGFLPEPPGGGGGAKGFWDRQGKPAIAPVRVEKADRTDPTDPTDRSDATAKNSGVRFSLYFFGHYPAEFRAGKYDLVFEAARFADHHGFSALWFPERHFHAFGGLSPNPSVLAAALARETERIALRAGSVVLPLHHPLRVAEEWALVDNLSGGRVGLSYASGWHPNDFVLAPEAYGRHRELMFERIEEVRRLWRGEALRVRDGAGKEVDVRIFPRPARRELAEWITIVNNPDTWRRAGEMGVGVLTNLMGQTVEGLTGMLRIYREALAAAGHPPERGHVTLLLHTYLDADSALAVERARRPFYGYLKSSVGLLQNMMASEGITADFDRVSEEDLEYVLEMAFQRYVRTSALIGSPESCAPIVERLRTLGVDEIACLIDFGVEPALVAAGLPVLAELKDQFDRFLGVGAELASAPSISVPLTEAQGDLYTVAQVGTEALRAYYESGVLELRGPLDLGLLRRALQGEVDRHEALRTVFPPPGEAQVVRPALRLEIPLLDASGCPPERHEEIAGSWLDELARDPFDLARGPLIRAAVMRLGERHHLLSIAVHHIVADGLSIGIVLGETLAAYEAMRAGRRPVLPRPMQFREYVAWLAETGTAERLADDEAYWLSELAGDVPGDLPVFEPPTDRPRPSVLTFRGRRQRTVLAAADRDRLLRFGRRHGATLYVTLLAAWTALLHRWTGQDDLIVGSPQAHRPLEGGDRLVGHCTDLIPLRSRLDETTFDRHLAALRSRVLGAHDHGGLSFSRLVRRLKPRRDPSRSPLVNTVFNLDPEWAMCPAGGLEIAERSPAMPYVKFDLTLHALSMDEGLVIHLDSRRDLFDAATIERLAGRLVALIEAVMEDSGCPIGELTWMTPADRAQLVAEVAVPYPRERTVHDLFAEVATEHPGAVAVEAGDLYLTYAELDSLANGWAHRLRGVGIEPDARVATILERSPELIVAWLAALKAGGAYVPLDPGFPEERLALLLTGSGAVAVMTVEEHREKVERALERAGVPLPILLLQASLAAEGPHPRPSSPRPSSPVPSQPPSPGEEGDQQDCPSRAPLSRGGGWGGRERGRGEGLAYVTFTSGSTGEPKGVAIPHRAVVRLVREADYAPLGPDDRVAHLAHVAFDATTFEIWGPLLNGGRVVVLDRDTVGSPHRLAAALRERGVTALFLTGALFNQMAIEEPGAFAGVRCVLTGGEAADPNRFRAVLAAGAPGRLVNAYGPTECTTFALWEPVTVVPEGAVSVPIGRPIVNTRVVILDGELCLGGDGLARGYLGRPDLTAERFVPDPQASTPGARLYRTGDRARMGRDGRVEYLGRLDRQVKIRGFRIEPGEIEAALTAHSGVKEVAVVAGEDRLGEKRLVAWFVPAGGTLTSRDLRDFLAARLPGPLIPAVFAAIPSLPLTPSGKVDRRALAERAPGQEPERKAEIAGPAERRAPLSFAQERLWFFDRLVPGSIAYNLPAAFHLRGPLAPAALAAALGEIVRRHEALRTVFAEGEGEEPEQVVLPFAGFPLPLVDLAALPDPRTVARRLIHEESRRPFDLGTGPLLRAFLLRLDGETHTLLLAAHHIVGDGWSFGVLGQELGALYRTSVSGPPSALPPLPIQYADFAVWQRSWLQGEVLKTLVGDWRRRLAGHPGVLELPIDRPRPLVQSFRGAIELLPFNALGPRGAADLRDLLRRLGRRHEATPFMVALAAYQVLLLGYTGEEDLLVGTPIANRNRGDVEGLIGFFVNTLPLHTDLRGDPTFTDLVQRVRAVALDAYAHQDLPFEKLIEAVAPDRDLSRNPLVQVAFAFQNNALPDRELAPGLACDVEFVDGGTAKFDLTLFLEEMPDGGLAGGFEYATDLFDAATVRRLGRHFLSVVRAAAATPDGPISELLVLTPEERRRIVEARGITVARTAKPQGEAPAAAESAFEAPRTPVEQIVAGVWAEVLALERIGVRESFFDLGGHSLLAGRVLSRLRAPLGVDLSLSEFFQEPTVAGLAWRVEAARRERQGMLPPPLVPVSRDRPLRLSFGQERLWLVDQLQPGSTAYNIVLPLLLRGRLDVPALTQSLSEIARRHEVLRTRFQGTRGGPVQVIEPVSWLGLSPLPRVDLDGLPVDLAQTELIRLAGLRTPFDLARGPLLRAVLVGVDEGEHALLVDMHHAISDGWSLDVMTRELSALYRPFSEGRPSPLPALPIQYADFAQWQRQWLRGEVVESQLAWWKERLGENPPPLDLPTDRPRPSVPSSRGETRGLVLSPELSARLEALARRQGGTLFIALLAAFQALLHRQTHQERIAVGTPVAGRTRIEVEELIGLFVNTLVLATDFDNGMTGGELLERARDATLGAFDHQDLPFEQLVATLVRDRNPGRQPLFQAMFVLQNNARTELDLRDLTLGILPTAGAGALFDLTLGAMETNEGIACGVTWATDLFDPTTILRFLEQYRRLLESLVEDPGRPVAQIPLLSAAERHQLEVEPPVRPLHGGEAPAAAPGPPGPPGPSIEEARRAELERRRSEVASRRGQLSAGRRALLRQWVGGGAGAAPPVASPLVEFRSAGSRPALFLVHAAGGVVHDYVSLAERLDPDQPFYGLQSPALAGGEHFATVPEMAARYREAVRSVQPQGPYRLGGYCVGGAVAFEMARQLRAEGEEVEDLVLIDSPGPLPAPEPPPGDDADMLASFVRTYGSGVEIAADELRAAPPEEWIDRVVARAREMGIVGESFDAGQLQRRWKVMRSNVQAITSYVPAGPLPLGAVLFRAARQDEEELRAQPVLGWERWLEGPIEVVDVAGGHLDVFQEPALEALVQGLRGLRVRTAVDAAI